MNNYPRAPNVVDSAAAAVRALRSQGVRCSEARMDTHCIACWRPIYAGYPIARQEEFAHAPRWVHIHCHAGLKDVTP